MMPKKCGWQNSIAQVAPDTIEYQSTKAGGRFAVRLET